MVEGSRSGVRDMSFVNWKSKAILVWGCLWTLGELGEEVIERRTGMETSASTGRAEGIADGDIVSLMKKIWVLIARVPLTQVNKGKRKSGICYLHMYK